MLKDAAAATFCPFFRQVNYWISWRSKHKLRFQKRCSLMKGRRNPHGLLFKLNSNWIKEDALCGRWRPRLHFLSNDCKQLFGSHAADVLIPIISCCSFLHNSCSSPSILAVKIQFGLINLPISLLLCHCALSFASRRRRRSRVLLHFCINKTTNRRPKKQTN